MKRRENNAVELENSLAPRYKSRIAGVDDTHETRRV